MGDWVEVSVVADAGWTSLTVSSLPQAVASQSATAAMKSAKAFVCQLVVFMVVTSFCRRVCELLLLFTERMIVCVFAVVKTNVSLRAEGGGRVMMDVRE